MDGLQKYDFGALDTLADGIDARVQAITTRLEDLRGKITNITTIWAGSANEGFQATRRKWEVAADDLTQVLAKIAVAVKTTNADAQQTENVNTRRW
jgi:WXG100 family type VII secretion target